MAGGREAVFDGNEVGVVHCHAGGEVGDVVVSGVHPPPGDTLADQAAWIATDERLRRFLLNEPRGGVFRHANLLVPPRRPEADAAFIIMEPADTPPMSGSNTICVATVLLEQGFLPMREPETALTLEVPGGLVRVRAACRDGRVESVSFDNLPSFVVARSQRLEVAGLPTLTVDTAWGGDSFVIVDVTDTGLAIEAGAAFDLARLGTRITAAANEQLGFRQDCRPGIDRISFCLFRTRPVGPAGRLSCDHAVAIRPGKIDRSPTGTGISAHLAVLASDGRLGVGGRLEARSIAGSVFSGEIVSVQEEAGRAAVLPRVSGSGFVFGSSRWRVSDHDPYPAGYRLNDTWPDEPAG